MTEQSPPAANTLSIDVTGWLLNEARAALQEHLQTGEAALQIIETAAPARASRRKNSAGDARQADEPPSQSPGNWRVLRCRLIESELGQGHIELLVAREQIGAR